MNCTLWCTLVRFNALWCSLVHSTAPLWCANFFECPGLWIIFKKFKKKRCKYFTKKINTRVGSMSLPFNFIRKNILSSCKNKNLLVAIFHLCVCLDSFKTCHSRMEFFIGIIMKRVRESEGKMCVTKRIVWDSLNFSFLARIQSKLTRMIFTSKCFEMSDLITQTCMYMFFELSSLLHYKMCH